MSYEEAMRRYGSDKPDLRNPLELIDVKDLLTDVDFKVFSAPANDPACRVTALRVPGGAKLSRGDIDKYTEFVKVYGARGLAYIVVEDQAQGSDGLKSPSVKNLHDADRKGDEGGKRGLERVDLGGRGRI